MTFRTCTSVLIREMKVKTQGVRLLAGVTLGYNNLLLTKGYYCESGSLVCASFWFFCFLFCGVFCFQEIGVYLIENASFAQLQRDLVNRQQDQKHCLHVI